MSGMKSKIHESTKRRVHLIFRGMGRGFNETGENFPAESLPLIDFMAVEIPFVFD